MHQRYLSKNSIGFFQISQVGPFLGQAHQFLHYNPDKSQFVEDKYIKYAKRIYQTLDNRLSKRKYIAFEYSIADIAIWPWIARFEIHKIDINDYTNVLRWYKTIVSRAAVVKGYNVENDNDPIPLS